MAGTTARLARITAVAARHAGPAMRSLRADDPFGSASAADADGDSGTREATRSDPERLASDLESLGATFVKLGQLLSTRHDLLPDDYTQALARLQDGVEPFPAEQVHEIIQHELGARVRDLFVRFDDIPLASASIGQVHRATTRSGREVVVKVQRPGVIEQVAEDMQALERVAGLVDATSAGQRVGTQALLTQFRRVLADELDYRKEAAHLERFRDLAADEPLLVVPEPLRDFCTQRVLTMEYVHGKKVTAVGPLGLMDVDGPALAAALFGFTLTTMLSEGVLHADPHPGNLLVTADGRLALIDLGMVATVPRRLQLQLVRLLLAVANGDGEQVAEVLASMGQPLDSWDAAAFRGDVSALVNGSLALGAEAQAGSILVELARLAGEHGLRPPSEMALVGKALLNLDQSTKHLDPNFRPEDAIREHLPRILATTMKPSAAAVAVGALDSKEFLENLPGRANRVLDALANGELTFTVNAFDEDRLLHHSQRLINRLTVGMILAALTLAAALMMRVPGGPRLFGYPALAVVFFLVAALAGLGLAGWILVTDREAARRARKRPTP